MELVTGRSGSPHITSQQDRQLHQGIFGDGAYILNTGNMLEPEVQSSNSIHIKDGALMFQGALFSVKVGTTDEVTINNGNQGMKRKDLVAVRYKYDSAQNKETGEWVVIQGTPAESNPVAPIGTSGNIQNGDATVDCPVFIVNLDGINVTGVDIIPEVAPTIPELNGNMITGKFSVSEEDTRMTWINGKKIYRKTLTTSETIDSSGLSVSHGISNPDEIWIDYSMSYMGTTSGIFIPLNTNRYNGKNIGITIITTKSDVQFNSDSSFGTGWVKVITLLYTKK